MWLPLDSQRPPCVSLALFFTAQASRSPAQPLVLQETVHHLKENEVCSPNCLLSSGQTSPELCLLWPDPPASPRTEQGRGAQRVAPRKLPARAHLPRGMWFPHKFSDTHTRSDPRRSYEVTQGLYKPGVPPSCPSKPLFSGCKPAWPQLLTVPQFLWSGLAQDVF